MKKFLIASAFAIAATFAVAATTNAAFSRNLSLGSTGTDVAELQTWLISKGFHIPAIESGAAATGYFGSQTQSAVAAYQATVGLPAQGFFGPLTMAKIAAGGTVTTAPGTMTLPFPCPAGYVAPAGWSCPGTSTGTVSTGPLSGTDGTIADVSKLSQYNNEEIGEGESDVKVVGFEVKASKEGDIALRSINVTFDGTSNGGSTRLNKYIDSVTVWQGSTRIGTVNSDDFNKDSNGTYSKTITLNNSVVRADKTEKFYIAVDAANTLDSGDISSDAWKVTLNSIRYEDGSGVVSSDSSVGDLPLNNVPISFVSFSTAADTKFKIYTDDSTPVARVVTVDNTDTTDGVLLLVGKIKIEGTSDVTMNSFPVTLTTTASTSLAAVTNSVTLEIDGNEYTESVSTTTNNTITVSFDTDDLVLDAGKTVTFKVMADVNDINPTNAKATDFAEGYVLKADVTSTNRDNIDVENEQGDQLSDASEKSGTAVGEYQEFRVNGITVTKSSATATKTAATVSGQGDSTQYSIKFTVGAGDEDVYIDRSTQRSLSPSAAGAGVAWATTTSSTAGATDVPTANFTAADTKTGDDANVFKVSAGTSRTFTLNVTLTATSTGYTGVVLTGINYTTNSANIASPESYYTTSLDTFKTEDVSMKKI